MDENLKDQILNLIDKSQSILLLTHAKADCDGLGSMISMYLALQAMGKEVVAATNDPAPDNLSFLPSMNIVQNSVVSRNFVITLDISQTPLNKIKYKLADDQKSVNIVVTPSMGRFRPEDVKFEHEEGNFDLIMTFDTGNLEHLGPIYDQNAELFFKVPVINVDHHASNTDYGTVNLVNVVSASTTEVLLELLEEMEAKYGKTFVTDDVATLLLAGLITDTGSFQHANTSPHAMETAAKLLDKGARQQEIIKNIYKTKKISTLKLWGTVLSKVQSDPIYRLVWSTISKQDLEETRASSDESETIIDDLLSNAPGTEIIMLFKYNDDGYVSVSMRSTTNSADVGKICQEMGGGGHVRAAGFKRRDSDNLDQLVRDTLKKVREHQGQRLNIHPDAHAFAEEKVLSVKKPEWSDEKPMEPTPEAKTVQYLEFKDERKSQPKKEPATDQTPEKREPEKRVSEKSTDWSKYESSEPMPPKKAKDQPKEPAKTTPKKEAAAPKNPPAPPQADTEKAAAEEQENTQPQEPSSPPPEDNTPPISQS